MADGKDDQTPGPAGPRGDDVPGRAGSTCGECRNPLAPDQRYCTVCGARRGRLPGAVAGTLAAVAGKGKGIAGAAGARLPKPKGGEEGWSWMPSPQAIAIAVIGCLALGVGLGSAMSEIASSAPLSTILLEYPHHAEEAPPEEEPEEEEEVEEEAPVIAEAPEEAPLPEEIAPLPVTPVEPLPEGGGEEGESEEGETPLQESLRKSAEEQKEREAEEAEEKLPEIKHAFLIVLGENSYESTFSAAAAAPYLTRTLPKKGELIPNYYGVTGGVLANEIALLSGQGPTPETSANCPNYTAISPGTVSATAEQVEGNGCVYANTVESLPTQVKEDELTWRAYVEDIEKGAEAGQPTSCRKPALGGPDPSPTGVPGDQYATWHNPVVYFAKIAEDPECAKLDVGFEALTRDLKAAKKTPALSLIFPDACHSGGEVECEPGAPTGAHGVVSLLKTLVPAIMASPAYAEGGLILITSAQAPQAGEHPDPGACCLAPTYPNLPPPAAVPATEGKPEEATAATPTTYTEESVLPAGGGGKVGLLMISPYVEPGRVEETEYANHFTLLKTLETMFGLKTLGYAGEEEMPTLSPSLFLTAKEVEEAEAQAAAKSKRTARPNSATPRSRRIVGPVKRRDRRAPTWAPGRTPTERAMALLRP